MLPSLAIQMLCPARHLVQMGCGLLPLAMMVRLACRSGDRARIHSLRGHTAALSSAVFSPDSQWVVTASDDQTARIWDEIMGWERPLLRGHLGRVNSALFSPQTEMKSSLPAGIVPQEYGIRRQAGSWAL